MVLGAIRSAAGAGKGIISLTNKIKKANPKSFNEKSPEYQNTMKYVVDTIKTGPFEKTEDVDNLITGLLTPRADRIVYTSKNPRPHKSLRQFINRSDESDQFKENALKVIDDHAHLKGKVVSPNVNKARDQYYYNAYKDQLNAIKKVMDDEGVGFSKAYDTVFGTKTRSTKAFFRKDKWNQHADRLKKEDKNLYKYFSDSISTASQPGITRQTADLITKKGFEPYRYQPRFQAGSLYSKIFKKFQDEKNYPALNQLKNEMNLAQLHPLADTVARSDAPTIEATKRIKKLASKYEMIPEKYLDQIRYPSYPGTSRMNSIHSDIELGPRGGGPGFIDLLIEKYKILGHTFKPYTVKAGGNWKYKDPGELSQKQIDRLKKINDQLKGNIKQMEDFGIEIQFYDPRNKTLQSYGKKDENIIQLINQFRMGKRKDGGLIDVDLDDTSTTMEDLPLLDPQESIERQKFNVGGFAALFGSMSKVPKAVARVGDMIKSAGKAEKATDVAVAQVAEDKPAMFLSTVDEIEKMPDVKMGAQQWLGTIKNKPGVSATELDEFGLEALLNNIAKADPKRKLSKTELLETYNKEMPKIDMDIAMAAPVERGAKDLVNMLTKVREKRGYGGADENLNVISNDPRLLTALHQPPQDATGMKVREHLLNVMRGQSMDEVNLLAVRYGGQNVDLNTGEKFRPMWENSFPAMYHGANDIIKKDHINVLKNLVPQEDIVKLATAKNIPEEQAFNQLYQALNIFDRNVMTADVPIPFWTKKLLYRLGDMSEGRGFFYKSKKSPAHDGAQFVPGGSGYGELKFYFNFDPGSVRAGEKVYDSGHFSGEVFQGNTGNSPFGWGRFSERIDENGRKILLMEEIQSDLHQNVAQKGYKYAPRLDKSNVLAEMSDFAAQLDKKMQTLESTRLRRENIMQLPRVERELPENVAELRNIERAMKKLVTDVKTLKKKVEEQKTATGTTGQVHPDAPFKKSENYAKVFLQGLMKMAADKGYDGIGLSTGKMKKAHGGIPKGGDKFYDEIGVKAMKRIAKKSGFKFKDTTIVDGNGFTWEKIPLIEMRDINTGQRIPGQSTIPVYSKGGFVKQNMVRGSNGY